MYMYTCNYRCANTHNNIILTILLLILLLLLLRRLLLLLLIIIIVIILYSSTVRPLHGGRAVAHAVNTYYHTDTM